MGIAYMVMPACQVTYKYDNCSIFGMTAGPIMPIHQDKIIAYGLLEVGK